MDVLHRHLRPADAVGAEGLRDRMFASYQEDMADIQALHKDAYELQHLTSDEATAGDYVDAAQYYATLGLANLAGGGLAGLAGKQLAKTGVKKLAGEVTEQTMKKAATRGFYGGVGASAMAQEIGATYGQAVEEQESRGATVDDVNNLRAFLGGAAAGSLEFVSDVFLLGAGRFLPDSAVGKAVGKVGEFATSGGMVTRAVKGLGVAAPVEAATEVGQTLKIKNTVTNYSKPRLLVLPLAVLLVGLWLVSEVTLDKPKTTPVRRPHPTRILMSKSTQLLKTL